jgi:coatomer protein complex subunit alpha (xenin)
MKIRYEVKSNRVKGLCFHPSLPWILSTHHNGSINVYDYVAKRLIYHFEEHVGPVRAIDIHRTQPIFATGGDDFKVKLWNLNEKRSLFTFNNHTDYIRSVNFHTEFPWILTASDDQTLRILNWQNRSCIAVLTGHSHYVMNAFFSNEENLIVSSSLDETIRIWDYSDMRKRYSSSQGSPTRAVEFVTMDISVRIVIDGHEKQVNWAAFHPKKHMLVSGADDNLVKVWKYQDTRARELETLRGHTHYVTCCLFHPKHDLVISVSEDKTLKVWDYNNRTVVSSYKRDTDRFWTVACHPTLNYLAAGHDGGFVMFKIEPERPPLLKLTGNTVVMVLKCMLEMHDLAASKAILLAQVGNPMECISHDEHPRYVYFNYFDSAAKVFIVMFRGQGNEEDWKFKVYSFGISGSGAPVVTSNKESCYEGEGQAVFTSKGKICYYRNKQVGVRCNVSCSYVIILELERSPSPGTWVIGSRRYSQDQWEKL